MMYVTIIAAILVVVIGVSRACVYLSYIRWPFYFNNVAREGCVYYTSYIYINTYYIYFNSNNNINDAVVGI